MYSKSVKETMTNKKETYNNNFNNPEELGADLSMIRRENNFKVPENYFDELPQLIQKKAIQKKNQFDFGSIYNYFTKPFRIIIFGSLLAVLTVGVFIITHQNDDPFSTELSFEEMMNVYPEIIEYMDEQVLIEFAASQMNLQEINFNDYEFGFDSIQLQNEIIQHLSDEEFSEIIYNL